MYVCVCHAVTDSQVRQAVHQGATMMRDLRQQLGVASECGRCACCARDILRTKDQMNRILAERTGQPLEKVKSDTERDYFLTADEAKDYGIIDQVIHKRS